MNLFSSGKRRSTLGSRVRRKEARAKKLKHKAELKARLAKAESEIKKYSK